MILIFSKLHGGIAPRREMQMKWYEIFLEFLATAAFFVTMYLIMIFVFIL